MRKHVFWLMALISVFACGYWLRQGKTARSDVNGTASIQTGLSAISGGKATLSTWPDAERNTLRETEPQSDSAASGQAHSSLGDSGSDQGEARAYNMSDPMEREELVAFLREQGVSEQEIQDLLRHSSVSDSAGEDDPGELLPNPVEVGEAGAFNMSSLPEREEFAASLREQGVSEEQIQEVLNQVAILEAPQENDTRGTGSEPLNSGETRTYDMRDPMEREEFMAALREKGMSDVFISSILKEYPDNSEASIWPELIQ